MSVKSELKSPMRLLQFLLIFSMTKGKNLTTSYETSIFLDKYFIGELYRTNYEEIKIVNQKIIQISNNAIVDLYRVTVIRLRNDSIEEIPDGFFPYSIEIIDLSHNHLKTLPDYIFISTTKLKDLDLSYNQLEIIKSSWFMNTNEMLELRLQGNRIKTIPGESFKFINQLRFLNLSHNFINFNFNICESYTGRPTWSIPSSGEVDLSNNNISGIPMNCIDRVCLLQKLNLKNNNLRCNCYIYDLAQYIENHGRGATNIIGNLTCLTDDNKVHLLTDLKPNDPNLNCDSTICSICPEKCSCQYHKWTSRLVINCTNQRLKVFPEISYRSSNVHYQIVDLDLSSNSLTSMNFRHAGQKYNIKTLVLTDNNIKKLHPSFFKNIKSLEFLAVDHNSIKTIDVEIVHHLKELHNKDNYTDLNLRLGHNPFDCEDCANADFKDYILSYGSHVEDADDVRCFKSGELLSKISFHFCNEANTNNFEKTIFYMVTLPLMCIFLLGLIIFTIILKGRILAKPTRPDHLERENKKFDVFISFSHEDDDFVIDLIKKLENRNNSIKITIDTRDWIPGEFIMRQMVQSIQNSRCSIIILSPAYVESYWCKSEFQLAMAEMFGRKSHKVIVVLNADNLDFGNDNFQEELKIYLKTCSYLRHNDENFIEKLQASISSK